MLRSLYISNIAIIERLETEFHPGMTSLTGETGAGKSVVIDALALALGKRADKTLLRHDTGMAEVIAEFALESRPRIQAWLKQQELDSAESECILRRCLYPDRPSRSFVNGKPVPAQTLNELGEQLVTICGQQEHLSLSSPSRRLEIVDNRGGLDADIAELGKSCKELLEVRREIEAIENTGNPGREQAELLCFLIEELEQGDFSAVDYDDLDQQQTRLAHANDIALAAGASLELLKSAEPQNISGMLGEMVSQLTRAARFDRRLEDIIKILDEVEILCGEAASELQTISGSVEADPGRLDEVERRLGDYHRLARKHRCEPRELGSKLETLQMQLDTIENRGKRLSELRAAESQALAEYRQRAQDISEQRSRTAAVLSTAVTGHLKALNLPDAVCEFECCTDTGKISPAGQDSVRILVSADPEQPPGPVEKIASGGELSRISLAIQLEAAELTATPVLVFDEVDAGVSGKTADLVGTRLRELSEFSQVICITHLPQVASKARHQLRVSKAAGTRPGVRLDYLEDEERVRELARILSGREITRESLANARVLLKESA